MPDPSSDSIAVIFQSGRMPEWARVPQEDRRVIEQKHVDLMLSVAREHGMQQMQGFRLVMPQHTWFLFWVMEFPTLAGAEAWIKAEIEPPYGRYGFHQYHLARRCETHPLSTPAEIPIVSDDANPHQIPVLKSDPDSLVAISFNRQLPAALDVDASVRGDEAHIESLRAVAREHGLLRLEEFALITLQQDWRQVQIAEFASLEGIEAWVEAEGRPPHGSYARADYYLARKWAPEYVASWIPR